MSKRPALGQCVADSSGIKRVLVDRVATHRIVSAQVNANVSGFKRPPCEETTRRLGKVVFSTADLESESEAEENCTKGSVAVKEKITTAKDRFDVKEKKERVDVENK